MTFDITYTSITNTDEKPNLLTPSGKNIRIIHEYFKTRLNTGMIAFPLYLLLMPLIE